MAYLLVSLEILLKKITAGIAASSPNAVASNASAIPGATIAKDVFLACCYRLKAIHYSPYCTKQAYKGAAEPVVAKKFVFFSKTSISLLRLDAIVLSRRCSKT